MSESAETHESGPILVCWIATPLPERCPCYQLSARYPDLNIQVEGCLPLGDGQMLERIRIQNAPGEGTTEELIRSSPDVRELTLVSQTEDSVLHQCTVPLCSVIAVHEKLHILPEFPFHIERGLESFLVMAQSSKCREFLSAIKEQIPGAVVTSISRDSITPVEGLLTERQREVFHYALTQGYWDVPRRTTLSELATSLKVSKSTLHEILSSVESKIIHKVTEREISEA